MKLGIARDTGLTKQSGFCTYPLWKFDEIFLKQIGGAEYEQYSEYFDKYMHGNSEDEDIGEDDETEGFAIDTLVL